MPASLPRRPFRNASIFGDGRRAPLDRNARARFIWLIRQDRRCGRLSATGEDVGLELVKMLGKDGHLDPSHETIRERVGCRAVSTVQESLNRLRDLGRVTWQRRLRRDSSTGWRAAQTSNAYVLRAGACDTDPPAGVKSSSKERSAPRTKRTAPAAPMTPEWERLAAQAALAHRRAVIEQRQIARMR